jgi:4a-hydroxytetrahydrobiopterin dehydratase
MEPALAEKECVPCRGGVPPLTEERQTELLRQLADEWEITESAQLVREFRFPDFVSALEFVNLVGDLAEAENHHPNIELSWGRVRVTIWTHKISGLTESDFILAAKIDRL